MASQPVLSYRTHKSFVLLLSTHCNAESMANVSLLLTTFLGWRIDTSFIGIYTPAPTICYILDATCCDNFIIMHLLYLLSYSNDGISQRSPTTRPDATPSRRWCKYVHTRTAFQNKSHFHNSISQLNEIWHINAITIGYNYFNVIHLILNVCIYYMYQFITVFF